MKAADIEWSMLRGTLIGVSIALVAAVAMLMASYQFSNFANKSFKLADRERRAAETRYRELDEQELMIASYYPAFQDLERQGIVGDEQRLKWIEALKQADENLKLPKLAYSINTQELHRTEFPLADGAYKLYASQMNLDLGLLHGQDLLELLRRLDDDAGGLYSVDSCSIRRNREDPGSPKVAHLLSTCRLFWFTINLPGARGAAS